MSCGYFDIDVVIEIMSMKRRMLLKNQLKTLYLDHCQFLIIYIKQAVVNGNLLG